MGTRLRTGDVPTYESLLAQLSRGSRCYLVAHYVTALGNRRARWVEHQGVVNDLIEREARGNIVVLRYYALPASETGDGRIVLSVNPEPEQRPFDLPSPPKPIISLSVAETGTTTMMTTPVEWWRRITLRMMGHEGEEGNEHAHQ